MNTLVFLNRVYFERNMLEFKFGLFLLSFVFLAGLSKAQVTYKCFKHNYPQYGIGGNITFAAKNLVDCQYGCMVILFALIYFYVAVN